MQQYFSSRESLVVKGFVPSYNHTCYRLAVLVYQRTVLFLVHPFSRRELHSKYQQYSAAHSWEENMTKPCVSPSML